MLPCQRARGRAAVRVDDCEPVLTAVGFEGVITGDLALRLLAAALRAELMAPRAAAPSVARPVGLLLSADGRAATFAGARAAAERSEEHTT
jgi:hypothetical protein